MLRLCKTDEKEDLAEVITYTLEELGDDEYTIRELADKIAGSVLANGYRRSGLIPSSDWDLLIDVDQCARRILADTMWLDKDGEIKAVCKEEVQRLAGVVEDVRDALSEIRRKVCGM
jgi:hypothetical protein